MSHNLGFQVDPSEGPTTTLQSEVRDLPVLYDLPKTGVRIDELISLHIAF